MKVHEFIHEMRSTAATFGRKHDIKVQFKGDQAYTDGKTITLPALPSSATLTNAQVKSMRGYLDHEAGHIRHSDMPRVIDFYDKCMNNGKEALKSIHNCLEDHWMEARVMDEYPGSRKNLYQLNETIASTNTEEAVASMASEDWSKFTSSNVTSSICTVGYEGNSGEHMKKLTDTVPDHFKEHVRGWVKHAIECDNSEEVITLAKSVYKLLEEDSSMSQSPEDFNPQAGEGMDEGDNSEEYKKAQAQGKEAGSGNPFDSNQGKLGEGQKGGEPRWVKAHASEALNSDSGDGASGCIGGNDGTWEGEYSILTPDNDVDYKRGTKETDSKGDPDLWDIVNSTDHTNYDNKKAEISGNINTMKTKLKRALLAKKQRDWDPGREVGRLDSKRLVSAYGGSRTVFKQRIDKEEEDTAVTILADLSGSMYGGKDDVAQDCVIALSECLSGSDISFNVVGFCNKRDNSRDSGGSYHRVEPLDTVFFKDFDTPLRVARSSIGQLTKAVGGNNSDYDFIVNAVNDLRKRPEARKVLFVLSDGHPACYSDANTHELVKHCKLATEDAKKKGVECVGIGIQDDAVTKIYSDNVVVHDVNELSSKVFHKLTKLLVEGVKRV